MFQKQKQRKRTVLWGVGLAGVVCCGLLIGQRWISRNRAENSSGDHSAGNGVVRIPRPPAPDNGFTGSRVCSECHAEIADAYRGHPMSRSLAGIGTAPAVENDKGRTSFAGARRHRYRVERLPGRMIHHESARDAEGQVIYDQAVEIRYIIGSGKQGRSYLTSRDGVLFLSPIAWYSNGKRWGLAPGYAKDHNPRFSRRATGQCLECHSGRLAVLPDAEDRFETNPFLEQAIGCEKCHGPGRAHVARQRSGDDSDGPDPIVNPARLDPARREAVCNQCHLLGINRVLRYGRTSHDFRPGMNLGDVWSVFVSGTRIARDQSGRDRTTRAVSHVEQMQSSLCYKNSRKRLGCVSCHDPHSVPKEHDAVSFYRAKCLQCHQEHGCGLPPEERAKPPAANSCIFCHMPKIPTNDVPHTAQTDHRILRRPDHVSGGGSAQGPMTRPRIFDEADCPLTAIEKRRAEGLLLASMAESGRNARFGRKAEEMLLPVRIAAPDDLAVLDALAICCVVQQKQDVAVDYWKTALRIDPNHEQVLFSLALESQRRGKMTEALEYVDRYLAVAPWSAEFHARRSALLASREKLDEALKEAHRALTLDPSIPKLYGWLADLHRRKGDLSQSRRFQQLLRRLQSP